MKSDVFIRHFPQSTPIFYFRPLFLLSLYVCTLAQLNLQPPGAFEIPLTSINCYAFRRIVQISISEYMFW